MQKPEVLFEAPTFIVLNKPAGLAVHADGKSKKTTLVDWLLEKYPELAGVGEEQTLASGEVIARPGIVHRLDRETSGVLVVARTQEAFHFLKKQFQTREMRKTYRAFVYGLIKDERGIIDKPIGSSRGGRGPRSALHPHGTLREAVTTYRVIERSPEASYIEVMPKTGRTHQIRVHMAALQRPVICDELYAANRPPLLGFARLALHALSLTFTPPGGKETTFTAPLPPDFLEAEQLLTKK